MLANCDGMALQADRGLRSIQQSAVCRTMRRVTTRAVIHHRRMFEYLGSADRLVTSEALFGLAFQHRLAASMRIMATDARHSSLPDRMMGAHLELCFDVLMAADANSRILVGPVG